MKNKFSYLLSFLTASLFYWISVSSSVAAPLVSIGDNTDIFFNGSSSLRWASNIFRDEENEESDSSWIISPGLEVNVGRGITNADFTASEFFDIDLAGSCFDNSNLSGAKFRDANLTNTSFKDCDLKDVSFYEVYFDHTDFSASDLTGVQFNNCEGSISIDGDLCSPADFA